MTRRKSPGEGSESWTSCSATGTVRVDDLVVLLGASPMTVRRELAVLEGQGRLRRTRGGAIPVQPLFYEPFRHDSTFQEQIEQFADEKRRIAAAAAELIDAGADRLR